MTKSLLVLILCALVSISACSTEGEYIPCKGKKEGLCGFSGRCVQCNSDDDCPGRSFLGTSSDGESKVCGTNSDCPAGYICYDRLCFPYMYCSVFGKCRSYCGPGSGIECEEDEVCIESNCEMRCSTGMDCLGGVGACHPEGYCTFIRCSGEGECPDGSEWVPRTLVCRELME